MKVLLIMILGISSSYGATSGTLVISGTVPSIISVEVSPEALASNLPLDTTQVSSKIATINESSNSANGYQVSISSDNLGKLIHETVLTSEINYVLTYGGNTVDLSSGDVFNYLAPESGVDKDINISYTGTPHESLIEGDYGDTITFSITAN